jgi:hypothetical protein
LDPTALIAYPNAIVMAWKCWRNPGLCRNLSYFIPQLEELTSFIEPCAFVPKRITHRFGTFSAKRQEDSIGNHVERMVVTFPKGFIRPGTVVPE